MYPFYTASAKGRRKLMSASSCEHGATRAQYDSAGDQRTPLPSGAYSSFPSANSAEGRRIASGDRNANNSVLFSSMPRMSLQLVGFIVEVATLYCFSPSSVWLTLSDWQVGRGLRLPHKVGVAALFQYSVLYYCNIHDVPVFSI